MIFKEIDFLSPQITLFYKGSLSHSSITSGILSLISFIIIIIFAIYYSLDFLKWQNPKAYYFIRFVDDAGVFPINSSSFFHYISLYHKNEIPTFDLYTLRVIGFETYYSDYIYNKNLSQFNHWIYGYCNFEKDVNGLSYLINKHDLEKSVCIRKFYNSLEHKYYDTGHPNFRWPILNHGNAHPNATSYSIVMERCEEETLELILGKGNKCKNELYLFKGDYGTKFNFIDHYVDLMDCQNPNRKYIYRVENTLDKDNYSINHININPSSIETNTAIFFDNTQKELSYIYDRNDVFMEYNKNEEVFMIFNLWLKNRMQHYIRIYKTLQDVISDIGGVSEIITLIAGFINSFYNNYITIVNFQKLMSPFINKNNINSNNNNKFKNINKNSNKNSSSISEKDISENIELEKKSQSKKEISEKPKEKSKANINNLTYIKEKEYKNNSTILDSNENLEKVELKENEDKIGTFIYYLFYKITCNKKNKSFQNYEKFRNKIMSEEHLLKNHLDVYSLLKMYNKNEIEFDKKYNFEDFMNNG